MFIDAHALPTRFARSRRSRGSLRALSASPRSLRTHVAAIVLLALALPLGVQFLGGIALLRDFTEERRIGLQRAAAGLAMMLNHDIAAAVQSAAALSAAEKESGFIDLERGGHAVATALDAGVLVRQRDGVLLDGKLARAYGPLANPRGDAFARRAAATGAPVLASQTGATPAISIFVSIDRSHVLEIVYPARRLTALLAASTLRPDTAESFLVDETGAVIAGSAPNLGGLGSILPEWLRSAILGPPGGEFGTGSRQGSADHAGFAALDAAPGWRMVVVERGGQSYADVHGPAAIMAAVAGVSVVLAIAAAVGAGAVLAGPLRSLTAAAQGVADGADSLGDVPLSPVLEFNELRLSVARADAVLRRRAAAERLALREARTGHELLASVVNAAADLIYVKDLELRFVLANRATLAAAWIDRDEWQVLGRREADIVEPEKAARLEALDREVLATGELRTGRIEWPHADGAAHLYAMTKTPRRDATGAISGVVTVVHDITDQRAAEQRLASVQGELLRASRLSAMGAMASGLAHELNQPLAAATNYLNASARLLARDDPGPVQPMIRAAVQDAVGQTLRAGAIVRRLRDFVGRGEADLNVENIGDIVSEIRQVAFADGTIDERQLVVEAGGDDVLALVERTQIQQVLFNLIRNASEAIAGAPDGRITVRWSAFADRIEITVADNGPGLAPDIRTRLFQPFASTKTLGMGIGLAICRTIVEGHAGRLTAEDNPAGGALFRIALPPALNDARDNTEST